MNKPDAFEAAIRDQAIQWFVVAQSGLMDALQHAELERWLSMDVRHQAAWQRLVSLGGQLRGRVDSDLASATLERVGTRRRALKTLASVGLFGVLGWRALETPWGQSAFADYRTATGERRSITLADGTRLTLNTATAVDVRFDTDRRFVLVKSGEIEIATANDSRPLIVQTAMAELRPLGTRFTVRSDTPDGAVWLTVTEGKVAARLRGNSEERVIGAGQGAHVSTRGVTDPQPLTAADTAWTEGVIIASRMRLADFLAELSRYRPGLLRCDPAVADLRLTGAYPIGNTDRVLDALAQTLPVSVTYRSRWWVSVASR